MFDNLDPITLKFQNYGKRVNTPMEISMEISMEIFPNFPWQKIYELSLLSINFDGKINYEDFSTRIFFSE